MKNTLPWKYATLFLLISIMVFLRLHSLDEPLERDLTTYAYISHHILDGEKLYTELWDHKPPGIYTAYMMAELFWGYDQRAVVYLGIVSSLVSLLFLYGFLNQITDRKTAMLGSAFWVFASNSIMIHANQPNVETFMNAFTIMALWSLTRWYAQGKHFLFFSGICFAVATWFKMNVIFSMAMVCLYLLIPQPEYNQTRRLKDRVITLAIFISPLCMLWGGTFSYFNLNGRLYDFWESVFYFNTYYSGNILKNIWTFFSSPDKLFHVCLSDIWILVLLSMAWLSMGRQQYGPLKRPFFILVLMGLFVEVSSTGISEPHYYQLLLPIFCILPALFFHDLIESANSPINRNLKAFLSSVTLAPLLLLSYHQVLFLKMTPFEISEKKYGDQFIKAYEIAQEVKKITEPSHKIYEWGAETGINYYSKRSSVTGIFYVYPLLWGPKEERLKKAQKVYDIVEKALRLIEARTKENPIKVFVKALENAAQREEIITIEYGGARYPKAVECAPQRCVDIALKHMAQGSYHKSFG